MLAGYVAACSVVLPGSAGGATYWPVRRCADDEPGDHGLRADRRECALGL